MTKSKNLNFKNSLKISVSDTIPNFKFQIGFTLIELLVVITVIGILAATLSGYFVGSTKRGRDVGRKTDISKYKLALENFATANSSNYPASVTTARMTDFCASYIINYIENCPEDKKYPDDSAFTYSYQAMGSNPLDPPGTVSAIRWVLWAKLESTGKLWVSCSNGKTSEVAAAGFTVTNGNCPL